MRVVSNREETTCVEQRPLSVNEAERLRRLARLIRKWSLHLAVSVIATTTITWIVIGQVTALVLLVALIAIVGNALYVPWLFETIIRKRGVAEDGRRTA